MIAMTRRWLWLAMVVMAVSVHADPRPGAPPADLDAGATEVTWHLEVSLKETLRSEQKEPKDPSNSVSAIDRSAGARFSLVAKMPPELGEDPGGTGVEISMNRATVGALGGDYSETQTASSGNQNQRGNSTSKESATATDRTGVSFAMSYHDAQHWSIAASAT